MSDALSRYHLIWRQKRVLRLLYNDIFERVAGNIVDGAVLEIGGGIGNLKEKVGRLISSDIQFAPWLDLVADGQNLPFRDHSMSNIVMVDVLHHVEYPSLLFREASRVLRAGGRIVMVEPGISLGSTLFYRFLHQEPVDMGANPLIEGSPDKDRDPYAANQAIPTLLATRLRTEFYAKFPEFSICKTQWFAMWAYPLSGGFKSWSLISARVARALIFFEKLLEPLLGRLLGFRLLIVIEKKKAGDIGLNLGRTKI